MAHIASTIKTAATLAKALDVDVPLFIGKALELSLRRDGGANPMLAANIQQTISLHYKGSER